MFPLQQIIVRFQQANEKAFYLSFLRVAVSVWFLKELLFRWPAFEMLYSNHSFLNIAPANAVYLFHIDPVLLKQHHMLVIYTCMVLLVLNIFGIGRNIVSILLFLALTLLFSINDKFNNSGDNMAMLLVFYLCFANSFSHFTLFKRKILPPPKEKLYNLLSNLAAYSMIINLCLAYFLAGLFKLVDPYWQNGTALHYFLNDYRFSVFAGNDNHVEFPTPVLYLLNYGTLLLELTFPVLVWYKKSRNWVLLLCFLMHAGIYAFLMIYAMSVIFVLQYGLFYSNEELLALRGKIRLVFTKLFSFTAR